MSRPPRKAIEQIKRYCEKTQCLRCIYGYKDRSNHIDYVYCTLQESNPCDWELKEDERIDNE